MAEQSSFLPEVRIINEGAVGSRKGQWSIPMSDWVEASRAVVLVKRPDGSNSECGYFNGSIIKFEDALKGETFGLLTRRSDYAPLRPLNVDLFKTCEVFFGYDEGPTTAKEAYVSKSGQELLLDDRAIREDEQIDIIVFPLKKDVLEGAFAPSSLPYLTLNGDDPKEHMVVYVIHHTLPDYKKCINSRFALRDTGPKMLHCATTSTCSRGAPIFTAGYNYGKPFLQFIGVQMYERKLQIKDKFKNRLASILDRDKIEQVEGHENVMLNVAMKTNIIDKFLKGNLTQEDRDRNDRFARSCALEDLYSSK